MKFPAGTDGGTISNPQDEGFVRELTTFKGTIEIETGAGHGFILTDNGKLVSAYFRTSDGVFRGNDALSHMTTEQEGDEAPQTFSLRKYTDAEFSQAVRISQDEKLLLPGQGYEAPPVKKAAEEAAATPELLDESKLRKIASQPGVIAASAFFEGFPVQYIGDADFEHVAASAEDLMRAGSRIAQEMNIGNLDQLILETARNKIIIAPCGDLSLCIFTTADAQLGLIRVVLKSIQNEIAG